MLRYGHTYRIYDWRKRPSRPWRGLAAPDPFYRITLALDPESRGGVYSPRVTLYLRRACLRVPDCVRRRYVRTYAVRANVLVLSFGRAYRWRRFGGLTIYRLQSHIVYRLFRAPKVAA